MPLSSNNPSRLLLILSGVALVTVLALRLSQRVPELVKQTAAAPTTAAPAAAPLQNAAAVAAPAPSPIPDQKLQEACDALGNEANRQINRQKLAELRAALSAMPTNEAAAMIRQFLDSKKDASTHLGFKLSSNGLLDDAPTLRTFLLDELGRVDPAAAADYSKVILASMDSPDEWAVALRNLAAGDTSAEGVALLQQKAADMLDYAPWQQNPSAGYLESFDVPVFLGSTDFVPALSSLLGSPNNQAVAHAAFLALDRLVINNPSAVLQSLADDPSMMAGWESTRADYFARANVTDPQQRQILENYLLNPSLSASELQTFAGIYPNANYMISPNLLTQSTTPSHDALSDLDAQSLAVAQQWLADPRFSSVAPALQTITQRLQGFAAQAKRGQ